MPSVVGKRGQIVVEKSIRDALGLQPGYIAVQHLVDDYVEIFFYPPEHTESLRGLLADHVKHSVGGDDWEKVREAAWQNGVGAEWKAHEGD